MASHYKVYFNSSESDDFCFMPTANTSTLGTIDQTFQPLRYSHVVPYSSMTIFGIVLGAIMTLFGTIANGLIAFVLIKSEKLRNEAITYVILSLVGANLIYLIMATTYNRSEATQLKCKTIGMIKYGLMFCSNLNLLGIGTLRLIKLNFKKKINEKQFNFSCKFVAASSWIFSFIVLLPTALGQWGQVAVECNANLQNVNCILINVNKDGSNTGYGITRAYYASYILIGFVNTFLNIAAYYKIQTYCKAISSDLEILNPDLATTFLKKERKLAKMLGTDSALYVILTFPHALLYVIDPYATITAYDVVSASYALWVSTSMIEPILLLAFQASYREEIKKIKKKILSLLI